MKEFALLNVSASLLMLGGGIAIHFFFRPQSFSRYPALRLAFQFWVLRWWFLAVDWVLFEAKLQQGPSRGLVLAFIDLDNIVNQAFCWLLLIGNRVSKDESLRKRIIFSLAVGFVSLALWNAFWVTSEKQWHIGDLKGQLWTLLSLILAIFNCLFIAFVFTVRYRWYGSIIILIQVAYAVLTVPAYATAFSFLSDGDYPLYTSLLALLKIFLGAAGYSLFAFFRQRSPLRFGSWLRKRFDRLTVKLSLPRSWEWVGVFIAALIAAFIVDALYHWLSVKFPKYLPE